MSYLIDTNAISELGRKRPHAGVVRWFRQRPARSMHLSVLSVGEIRKGVELLTDVSRRAALLDWLELEIPAFFQERLLAIDLATADQWGRLVAAAGRPLPAIDSLLAATALTHGLTLVTRNTRDFQSMGVSLIDPWSSG